MKKITRVSIDTIPAQRYHGISWRQCLSNLTPGEALVFKTESINQAQSIRAAGARAGMQMGLKLATSTRVDGSTIKVYIYLA